MAIRGSIVGIDSPEALEKALRAAYYLADEGLATAAYLALALGKPLLLEGAPGVGKTEAAKAVAAVLARRLIRLQCYEGIDASAALYEWNYPRQMLAIRQAGKQSIDIYSEPFLIERPMLAALRNPDSSVLLIDEIDRSDQEFEAFLLEFLSDFQISIPERGTLRAVERPVVILTSNRTRDLHEALRRRCVYHWIDYPSPEREARIIMMRASSVAEQTARAVVAAVGRLRREPLSKAPGIAEAVDWAEAATLLNRRRALAGRIQTVDRRRAQGRGRPRPCRRPPRFHPRRGCRMNEADAVPRAARPFLAFVALLRANGFAIAPEQTTAFLAAISLLGPRDPEDVRQAGLATLAPPPERHAAYNIIFRIHFLGEDAPALGEGEDEETVRVQDDRRGDDEPPEANEVNETGEAATRAEALVQRRFGPEGQAEALRRLGRQAGRRLPRRRSYRRMRARRGAFVDLRRTLRDAARNDGEVIRLSRLRRRLRPRKLLLLIDVSGSMKTRTEENLRLAHALAQAAPRIEVFTFGTRLTRVSRPMRLKRREQALAAAAQVVSDFDGGTRIGDALQAFLVFRRGKVTP